MKVLKKFGWQITKVLLFILDISRVLGIVLCVYASIFFYGWKVMIAFFKYKSLATISNDIYLNIVLWGLGGIILAFSTQFLKNAQGRVDDKVLENTTYYFSKEKLERFKRDALVGNLSDYTFDEIYKMSKTLEDKGEKVVTDSNRYNTGNQYVQNFGFEEKEVQARTEDEEKIISSQEIQKFTHAGVSNPMKELDELLGLDNVKEQVQKMKNRYLFEMKREQHGVSNELSTCNHMCFVGPPGTGKTTVARIMSGILYDLKIIRKNQVVEISGNDLQGQYLGYTGKRTKALVEAARGGVLFVDEAYSLSYGGYADEALGELVKAMEDYKDDLVVIFAGYENEMQDFLQKNSGMSSRIKTYIYFSNYSSEALSDILVSMAAKAKYTVTKELKNVYADFSYQIRLNQEDFGNARTVRGDLDTIIEKHADNVISGKVDESKINVLDVVDFPFFANN